MADEIVRLLTTKKPGDMMKARSLITRESKKLDARNARPGKIRDAIQYGGFGLLPAQSQPFYDR